MEGTSEPTSLIDCGSTYYVWGVPHKEVAIRLNFDVVDRLGDEVAAKFADLGSRVSEIGGILLGRVSNQPEKTFFIEDFQTIQCDDTYRTLFAVPDECKAQWVEQLFRAKISSRYSIVGFFRSHTRKNLSLDEHDLALITEYFPGPSTVFLLIKPFARKPSTAGFFIWEEDQIRAESSYREFPFKRAELLIRMPQSIVLHEIEQSAPAAEPAVSTRGACASSASGQQVMATTNACSSIRETVTAPTWAHQTGPEPDDSLATILRRIKREPAEQSTSNDPIEFERDFNLWGRVSPEASIPSEQNRAAERSRHSHFTEESSQDERFKFVEPGGPLASRSSPIYERPDHQPRTTLAQKSDYSLRSQTHIEDSAGRQILTGVRRTSIGSRFRSKWLWLILPLALGTGYEGLRTMRSNNALNLSIDSGDKEFVVHWNPKSDLIRTAKNVILRIQDGSYTKDCDLNAEQLRFGSLVYFPLTDDVKFRLQVIGSGTAQSNTEWVRAIRSGASGRQELADARNLPFATENLSQKAEKAHKSSPKDTNSRATAFRVKNVLRSATLDDTEIRNQPRSVAAGDSESLRSDEPVVPARLVRSIRPEYPPEALLEHVSGLVTVRCVVGTDGKIKKVIASRGPALLCPSAIEAVQQFVYEPATRGGQPIESEIVVNMNFIGNG